MDDYQLLFVGNLLAYAAQRDLSPEHLCQLSGIELEGVKQRTHDPLTARQFDELWRNASRLSHDPLFGLHLGESLQLAALGIVGQIVQTSQTVGHALTQATQFIHLLTDLFEMEIDRSSQFFTIRFIPYTDRSAEAPVAQRQMLDLSMAFVLHEVDGLLLEKISPETVLLPYDATSMPEYGRVLRCAPTENTGEYALVFDARYWDEPILTANYEWQQMLLQKASSLSKASVVTPALKERILSFLVANAYLGVPTLEEIAANFNTSSRSLQRKLQDEGVTYQQLADSIRKSLALHYLESGKYPIKEISYLLGYNELSAFSRAFKRWTGRPPVSYQKS
ncbi:AraC family transcriptional regulator [Spirosoma koreense]